jgi:hypothetical protein
MAFSVNEFRSQMTGDGARPNLFEVSMPFPSFASPANAQTKLTFMCKTAQLPGSTVGVVPVNYFGRELKFVGNRTFADWTISVINDEDFIVRNAFERWMNGINSHNFNVRNPLALAPLGYSVDSEVTQFGKQGNTLKKYRFVGVFPTDVTPIDVDWGSNDTIEEFSVTLSYQWWDAIDTGVL